MGHKIVIVDDETKTLKMLSLRLKHQGFEVFTAEDGEAGLALIKEIKPICALIDGLMPKKSGFEVIAELKSEEATKDIYCFILTALAEDSDKQRAADVGVDSYVTKPFDGKELVELIVSVIDKRGKDGS